ncbi:hypothetical protein [Mucilaginibacter pineti]|uniref:hypothetical protein n=1 Tax=Mucilaginibacter pineti TaxID=1391627 RepID=UPI00115F8A33|nr:hypothetical protein [Mucilaginibacter pineti]
MRRPYLSLIFVTMLIYLDLNVIQDIKQAGGEELLMRIKQDQQRNVYCFSEAHLYDLSRDQTDHKYTDMELIAEVAGDHCIYFEGDRVRFDYETPREYFGRFDWSTVSAAWQSLPDEANLLFDVFKLMPLNFTAALHDLTLPEDMPDVFKDLLTQTVTYYDFFAAFMDYTVELSEKQKSFRALLQYLRSQDLLINYYEYFGLKGYDGTRITDQAAFLESYSAFCAKNVPKMTVYQSFIRMYYCLEFLGLVKGKADKQKMMNLANDGRHAFFGGYCDIVVSKDEDFRNKAKFMYEACGIHPWVIGPDEFRDWITAGPPNDDTLGELYQLIGKVGELECIDEHETDDTRYTTFALPRLFYDYFGLLTFGENEGKYFFYLTAEKLRFNRGTWTPQISVPVGLLLKELGMDLQGKGEFQRSEVTASGWPGRAWLYGNSIVELICEQDLYLKFNPVNDIPAADKV